MITGLITEIRHYRCYSIRFVRSNIRLIRSNAETRILFRTDPKGRFRIGIYIYSDIPIFRKSKILQTPVQTLSTHIPIQVSQEAFNILSLRLLLILKHLPLGFLFLLLFCLGYGACGYFRIFELALRLYCSFYKVQLEVQLNLRRLNVTADSTNH